MLNLNCAVFPKNEQKLIFLGIFALLYLFLKNNLLEQIQNLLGNQMITKCKKMTKKGKFSTAQPI